MAVSKMQAIRDFLAAGPNGSPVSLQEFKQFKDSCTPEQWDAYAAQAAKSLGVELQP